MEVGYPAEEEKGGGELRRQRERGERGGSPLPKKKTQKTTGQVVKIGKLLTKVTLTHMSRSSPSYCNVTQSCFFFFFSKNISFVLRCDSMEPKNVDRHMRVVVMAPSSRQPSTHRPLSLVACVSHSCIRIKKPSSAVVIENNFGFFLHVHDERAQVKVKLP